MATKKKIGVPKQPEPIKRVRITAPDAGVDCQGRITIQKGLRVIVPQSPKYAPNSRLATAFDAWSATTDKAAVIYQNIIDTEAQLESLYTSLGTVMGQFSIDRDGFVVAAQAVCQNEDDASALGLATAAARKSVDAESPSDIRFIFSRVMGELTVRWPLVPGAGAYAAEQSVDPPSAASWVDCYMGKAPSFKLTSLTPGQKLWVRVKAIGKTPSAWSDPVSVVAR